MGGVISFQTVSNVNDIISLLIGNSVYQSLLISGNNFLLKREIISATYGKTRLDLSDVMYFNYKKRNITDRHEKTHKFSDVKVVNTGKASNFARLDDNQIINLTSYEQFLYDSCEKSQN